MIRFTQIVGTCKTEPFETEPLWLNPRLIACFAPAAHVPGAKTGLCVVGDPDAYHVTETPEEVVAAINLWWYNERAQKQLFSRDMVLGPLAPPAPVTPVPVTPVPVPNFPPMTPTPYSPTPYSPPPVFPAQPFYPPNVCGPTVDF